MAKYEVWYMRPDWFRAGILREKKPDPANLDKTHIHLKDVEVDDRYGDDGLERVWVMMQGEEWSPNGEARPLIEAKGLRHTSMSLGDVVVKDGKAFVVAAVGFEPLGAVAS